jgi:hypothetical protein
MHLVQRQDESKVIGGIIIIRQVHNTPFLGHGLTGGQQYQRKGENAYVSYQLQ